MNDDTIDKIDERLSKVEDVVGDLSNNIKNFAWSIGIMTIINVTVALATLLYVINRVPILVK